MIKLLYFIKRCLTSKYVIVLGSTVKSIECSIDDELAGNCLAVLADNDGDLKLPGQKDKTHDRGNVNKDELPPPTKSTRLRSKDKPDKRLPRGSRFLRKKGR